MSSQPTEQAWIQQEILDCLLDLEDLTTELLTCGEEQLIDRLDERQQILGEIDDLLTRQRRLDEAAAPAPEDPDAADTAAPDAPPEQDEERWRLAEECRAAACRMQELDRQVVARLQNAQQRVLQKIRAAGKSAGAHAARYYVPTTPASTFTGSM